MLSALVLVACLQASPSLHGYEEHTLVRLVSDQTAPPLVSVEPDGAMPQGLLQKKWQLEHELRALESVSRLRAAGVMVAALGVGVPLVALLAMGLIGGFIGVLFGNFGEGFIAGLSLPFVAGGGIAIGFGILMAVALVVGVAIIIAATVQEPDLHVKLRDHKVQLRQLEKQLGDGTRVQGVPVAPVNVLRF